MLSNDEMLESVPARRRFEVREGACVVPPELQRVGPITEEPDRDLPAEVAREIAVARRDPDRTHEILAEIAAANELDERSRSWLALMRGWHAHRSGDVETRSLALDEMESVEDAYRSVVAGTLLLAGAAGRTPPAWALDRVGELDGDLASGLPARLREFGAIELAAEVVERRAQVLLIQHVVDVAVAHHGLLVGTDRFLAMPVSDELLLFYPSGQESGVGAVVDPVWLLAQIRERDSIAPVRWLGEAVRSADVGDEAVEQVVAGSIGLVAPELEPLGWSGPMAFTVIVLALALCFGVGLLATARVMRAETKAVRTRSEFLQSVTHELKTPLASIRLLAERLERGRVNAERQPEYFGMLADEAERLSVLIENVLDLGRIERGERAYDFRRHELVEIVGEAIEVFRPLAHRDGIEVRLEANVDAVVGQVDRGAIVQSLLNVLENARKYARDGARVVVRVAACDGELAIDVRDFGPGIEAAERDSVFERFKRGARHQDGSVAGVGLGLHLSRCILRAHGGELDCVEPDGVGAQFRFRIPLDHGEAS